MYVIIFTAGMICALLLMWWHLQRAVTCADDSGHRWCRRPWLWRAGIATLLALLAFGPRLWFLLTRQGLKTDTLPMVFSFTWMVMVMWFCTAALAMDAWNCVVVAVQFLRGRIDVRRRCVAMITPRWLTAAAAAFAIFALVSGWHGARHPRVVHQEFFSPLVPESADGYRLMLISDLHLRQRRYPLSILDAVEVAVREEKPDLIVHAGDFIDGPWSGDVGAMTDRIAAWPAPDGKIAVFGNHDGYAGWEGSRAWHERAGFELVGQRVGKAAMLPTPWLHVAGSDDEAVWFDAGPRRTRGMTAAQRAAAMREATRRVEALPEPPPGVLAVLLRHRPIVPEGLPGGYRMMLSGHTHGGQVFPFNLVVYATYGLRTGIPQCSHALWIYICRGTGFWGPPLRFLEPPEIVIITFRKTAKEKTSCQSDSTIH